nr:DUF6339 family protein [Cryobacterium arcticum]
MLPAEAADEGVWSFLTLNVCPDVAFWRFPNARSDDGSFRTDYERLLGRPRNVLRRSWWRGYILGADLSGRLLEDESVGIMERPSLGGDPTLARSIARAHLAYAERRDFGRRQDLLRESAKRLRRRFAVVSVHSLQPNQVDTLVRDVFAETFSAMNEGCATASSSSAGGAMDVFQKLIPGFWECLRAELVVPDQAEIDRLRASVPTYVESLGSNRESAMRLGEDLGLLHSGWESRAEEAQRIVRAVTVYFLDTEDNVPDYYLSGLKDDDHVIAAAFTALGLARAESA